MAQPKPDRKRVLLLATDRSHSIIGEIVDGKTNAIAYSTYGEQSAQQEIATRLGFNGQTRERSIGWYLLGNGYRAYNPRLMRFHSPDSWSPFGRGGLNAYMYCVGDPVNRSDPTGHSLLKLGAALLDKMGVVMPNTTPINHVPFYNRTARHFNALDVPGIPSTANNIEIGMRPEGGDFAAVLNVGADLIRPRQRVSMGFKDGPKGDGSTHGMKWGTTPPFVPTSVVPKRNPLAPRTHRPAGAVTITPHSAPPPSYEQATSGMKLWNHDTFAASQQPQTYVVNRMAVGSMENLGAAAPYQAPAGAPPPAQVAEVNNALRGLQELNDMQRDVIQHRAANVRRCEIL